MSNAATCRKCNREWTGLKMAHCGACHETFSTPANFDKHRDRGKCLSLRALRRAFRPVDGPYGLTWVGKEERFIGEVA